MTNTSDRFLQALRAARKAAGLTQAQAAERMGISQSLWSTYERGALMPGFDQADRLAEAVGKTMAELLADATQPGS